MRFLIRFSTSLLCASAALLAESQPLDSFSYDQLRVFLKGYDGDWRPHSDREKGIPAPPATKSSPEGARRMALPPPQSPDGQTMDLKALLESRRSLRRRRGDVELAALDLSGLLHVAGPDAVSRAELAELVTGAPVRSAPAPAGRPLDCRLDSTRAVGVLATRLRGVREVLAS